MFSIKCHSCGAVYELDESLVGEIAECAECPALFKIVAPPPGSPAGFIATGIPATMPAPKAPAPSEPAAKPVDDIPTAEAEAPTFGSITTTVQKQEAAAPKKESSGEEFTNTVKLKRPKSEGMIPKYNTPWRQGAPGTHSNAMPKEEKLKDVATVKCPFCNQEYELSKDMIGNEVQCAACNKTFVVPRDSFVDRPSARKDVPKLSIPSPAAAAPAASGKKSFLDKLMFWKKWIH